MPDQSPSEAESKKRGRGRPKLSEQSVDMLDVTGTKGERLQALYSKWYACQRCDLGQLRMCSAPNPNDICFGEGNPDAHCLIVGEAPGEEEEASSLPFVGRSGQLLNQILALTSDNPQVRDSHQEYSHVRRRDTKNGLQAIKEFHESWFEWRNTQFFITNTVACRPPENRTPNYTEVKACWERLWNIIYIVDPMVIIACGNTAMSSLMQKMQVQVSKMRGNVFDVSHIGRLGKVTYPVIPVFHPSYLLRKADWDTPNGDFSKTVVDVRKALRLMDFLRNQHFGTPIPAR